MANVAIVTEIVRVLDMCPHILIFRVKLSSLRLERTPVAAIIGRHGALLIELEAKFQAQSNLSRTAISKNGVARPIQCG